MEDTYYLAVETKPNNYFPINLIDLNLIPKNTTTKLEELDKFTLNYTIEELRKAIKESNILDIDDNMPLVIIYNEKHATRKINVLTKDISFDMWKYIKDNFSNKNFLNKVYNFLQNKTSTNLSAIKNPQDIKEYISNLAKLPYPVTRKLYFYLYEK